MMQISTYTPIATECQGRVLARRHTAAALLQPPLLAANIVLDTSKLEPAPLDMHFLTQPLGSNFTTSLSTSASFGWQRHTAGARKAAEA